MRVVSLWVLYRLIAHFRMTDLIDRHISLRVPDEDGHFLINQYGIPFEKMTASHLVKIDYAGNIIADYDQATGQYRRFCDSLRYR